jgi:hypothetical protein
MEQQASKDVIFYIGNLLEKVLQYPIVVNAIIIYKKKFCFNT